MTKCWWDGGEEDLPWNNIPFRGSIVLTCLVSALTLLTKSSRLFRFQRETQKRLKMTTPKDFLTVPLIRKYGSMPSLAQKSMISLEYNDSSLPRRVSGGSDPPKIGNKQSGARGSLELPLVRRSMETPAKNDDVPNFRREIGWRSPLLERRQTLGVGQEIAGATTTPNKEKTTDAKRWLEEDAKFLPNRHSEWLNRISSFNERVAGVKTADAISKTRVQITGQNKVTNTGKKPKGAQLKKSQFRRKTDVPKKTVLTANNDPEKYSQVFSVEREFFFQGYRQKCIQWLKSLPDNGTQPMNLR